MKSSILFGGALLVLTVAVGPSSAATCTTTSFNGLTAALINPVATVSGVVDATGCDIGVYYNHGGNGGRVKGAEIKGAKWYGVVVHGDFGAVAVDVLNSSIHNIGDVPFNGNQRGVAVYYRAFFAGGSATGRIVGNAISAYQKGGIVTNGRGARVTISDNTVTGLGPVGFIAQNGIQIGYGADASVMRNTVTSHSYTGASTVSGGIIVVGGAGYGVCPDGDSCPYTANTQIVGNIVRDNDIGVFLTNIDGFGGAPAEATNVKAVNNTISSVGLTNNYGGFGYQAGVSDVGNNDKIITNKVSGPGYDPAAYPAAWVFEIDADVSFTNRPKVHANR